MQLFFYLFLLLLFSNLFPTVTAFKKIQEKTRERLTKTNQKKKKQQ